MTEPAKILQAYVPNNNRLCLLALYSQARRRRSRTAKATLLLCEAVELLILRAAKDRNHHGVILGTEAGRTLLDMLELEDMIGRDPVTHYGATVETLEAMVASVDDARTGLENILRASPTGRECAAEVGLELDGPE